MKLAALTLVGLGLLAGCASVPSEAPVVPIGELERAGPALSAGDPIWIELQPGDQLPLYIDVQSPLVGVQTREPVTIAIKRRVYLLIGDGMPRFSYDRQTLLDGGGSFRFGIGKSKERGSFTELVVQHQPE